MWLIVPGLGLLALLAFLIIRAIVYLIVFIVGIGSLLNEEPRTPKEEMRDYHKYWLESYLHGHYIPNSDRALSKPRFFIPVDYDLDKKLLIDSTGWKLSPYKLLAIKGLPDKAHIYKQWLDNGGKW